MVIEELLKTILRAVQKKMDLLQVDIPKKDFYPLSEAKNAFKPLCRTHERGIL